MTPKLDKEGLGDDRLRDFFQEVHAEDRAPSFGALVRARPRVRRPGWSRPAVAIAAVLVVAIAVAWLMPNLGGPGPAAMTEEEQLALAHELSGWRGPLDFLLETPGREVLFAAPSFELTTLKIPPPADREETQP